MKVDHVAPMPVKLFDTRIITRPCYQICLITDFKLSDYSGGEKLSCGFEVISGKRAGFRITTDFFDTYRSRARLTHLCNSVGIYGELTDPSDLVGRKVKLRIVPKYKKFKGRTYLEHRITRFHNINRKF